MSVTQGREDGGVVTKLTLRDIEEAIVAAAYYVFPGTVMTVCCLTLKNGYQVVGEGCPACAANFNEEIGRKIAYEHARAKIWSLEGYRLRQRLFDAS